MSLRIDSLTATSFPSDNAVLTFLICKSLGISLICWIVRRPLRKYIIKSLDQVERVCLVGLILIITHAHKTSSHTLITRPLGPCAMRESATHAVSTPAFCLPSSRPQVQPFVCPVFRAFWPPLTPLCWTCFCRRRSAPIAWLSIVPWSTTSSTTGIICTTDPIVSVYYTFSPFEVGQDGYWICGCRISGPIGDKEGARQLSYSSLRRIIGTTFFGSPRITARLAPIAWPSVCVALVSVW
jgi:hypothetical protein